MGYKVIKNAKNISNKILTPTQKHILGVFCFYADDSNPLRTVYPSLNTLVEDTGYARSAIQKAIKVLIEKGFLILQKSGSRKSNEYLINSDLFNPIVNIECRKLSPGSVYNPVNNPVDNSRSIPSGGWDCTSRKASTVPPGGPNHISSSIDHDHMIGGQQDDFLEKDVDAKMEAMGIFERERKLLISQYGIQTINLELRDLSGRRGIKNKGPYLRKVLEQKYGRLIRYKRAVGY